MDGSEAHSTTAASGDLERFSRLPKINADDHIIMFQGTSNIDTPQFGFVAPP